MLCLIDTAIVAVKDVPKNDFSTLNARCNLFSHDLVAEDAGV